MLVHDQDRDGNATGRRPRGVLIDFEFVTTLGDLSQPVFEGTPQYVANEVISGGFYFPDVSVPWLSRPKFQYIPMHGK